MALFSERLKCLFEASKKSINQIERELGYPRNALNNYKNGAVPSAQRIIEISNYFGVLPDYLLGTIDVRKIHNSEIIFENLNDKEKMEMFNYCQQWFISKLEAKI